MMEHKRVWDNVRGEVYCSQCGLVLDDEALVSLQPRNPDGRVGMYSSMRHYMTQSKIGSMISRTDKDIRSRSIPKSTGIAFSRLRRQHHKPRNTEHTTLVALNYLHVVSSQLKLPEAITQKAGRWYRKLPERFMVGHAVEKVILAVVHLVCEENKIYVPVESLVDRFGFPCKEIRKEMKRIKRELGIGAKGFDKYLVVLDVVAKDNGFTEVDAGMARVMLPDMIKSGFLSGRSRRVISLFCLCKVSGYVPKTIEFKGRGSLIRMLLDKYEKL